LQSIVVVSLAGYDEIYRDLDYLGRVSGNPDLAKGIEGLVAIVTRWQGLAGLDKTKPVGGLVRTDGVQYQYLAFVPAKDLPKLFDVLSNFIGEPEKLADDRWRVTTSSGSVFVKRQGPWAFISPLDESLNDLPTDPQKLLEGLDTQYDLAVRLHVQAIPELFRQIAMDKIRDGIRVGLADGAPVTDDTQQLVDAILENNFDEVVQWINQVDHLTLGWSIDAKHDRSFLDVSLTAIEESPLAQELLSPPPKASRYAGFMPSDAIFKGHTNRVMSSTEIERTLSALDSLKLFVASEVQKGDSLKTDAEKQQVQQLVDQLAGVLSSTIKQGVSNGGLVVAGKMPFTVATGARVADGRQLEQVFLKTASLFGWRDIVGAKSPKSSASDVNFYQFPIPLARLLDVDDDFVEILGGTEGKADLTVGFGPESIYLALGHEGRTTLDKAIERSRTVQLKGDARLELNLDLAPLLAMAQQRERSQGVRSPFAPISEKVQRGGKAHLVLTTRPIPNGVQTRIEAEQGLLMMLGFALKTAASSGRF
jgi:hypothetical protein